MIEWTRCQGQNAFTVAGVETVGVGPSTLPDGWFGDSVVGAHWGPGAVDLEERNPFARADGWVSRQLAGDGDEGVGLTGALRGERMAMLAPLENPTMATGPSLIRTSALKVST